VVAAGRRFGKSWYASVKLGVAALSETNRFGHKLSPEQPVYYVAPTFDQAVRTMRPKLLRLLGWAKDGGFIVNENINNGWLELLNGVKIYLKGAENDDALRGEGNRLVVLDEYASMAPHVWPEILEPTLMDVEGDALFIGTPKGKNHFYRLFMDALTHPEPYWNDWEAFHFTSNDNPFLKERELKRIVSRKRGLEGLDPKDRNRQEIEADFISGGSKILRPDSFPIVKSFNSREARYYVTVDLAGFKKGDGNQILKTDESVVAVTAVDDDMWTVVRIQHGHWEVRETATRILLAVRAFPGCRLGIEAGALDQAVRPYLEELMREYQRYVTIEPLKHNNARKQDRISWALSGRSERGLIQLLTDKPEEYDGPQIQPWNNAFLDQVSDFPDPLAHDDLLDAVAYVDQLSVANTADDSDVTEWEALDLDAGY
jgi:HSP20 family molecular chaperone IbpA